MFTPCSKMLLEKIRVIFFQTSNKFPTSVETEGAVTSRLLVVTQHTLVLGHNILTRNCLHLEGMEMKAAGSSQTLAPI